MVNGRRPNGLTGASGIPLDGSGRGQPSTDFGTTITRRTLGTRDGGPADTFAPGAAG